MPHRKYALQSRKVLNIISPTRSYRFRFRGSTNSASVIIGTAFAEVIIDGGGGTDDCGNVNDDFVIGYVIGEILSVVLYVFVEICGDSFV